MRGHRYFQRKETVSEREEEDWVKESENSKVEE